ncbi:hypothetical protein ACQ7HM_14010 [Williamsia sp. MIQD14]|uniref:hypothetical protein n=1 Tax=Williamsia sp. MIQD14 TaxID=3425703 RepID=UPI003DA1BB14
MTERRMTDPPPRYVDAAFATLLCGTHAFGAVTIVPYLAFGIVFAAGFGNYGEFDATPYDLVAGVMVLTTLILAVVDWVVTIRRGRSGRLMWPVCLTLLVVNAAGVAVAYVVTTSAMPR